MFFQVWDILTNREVVAVSQAWEGSPGVVVAEWQAPNIPTLIATQCPRANSVTSDHTYTYIASALSAGDDILTGSFNLSAAQALCSSLAACAGFTYLGTARVPAPNSTVYFKSALNINGDSSWSAYGRDYTPTTANLTNWTLTSNGLLMQGAGDVCVDTLGQQPQLNAPNWLRMRACNASFPSQIFSYNAATRTLVSNATGQCLTFSVHWLWNWQSLPTMSNCNQNDTTQVFSFGPDNTLVNAASDLCTGSSDVSGPASQIWVKPLSSDGSKAVFVINGALLPQHVDIDLASVNVTGPASVRDLWMHTDLGVVQSTISVSIGPHDSAMLLLTPTSAAK